MPMSTCSSGSRSSDWYQQILWLTSAHGGDEHEMLVHDGAAVLQLHELDAAEHPHPVRAHASPGNGVAVWFESVDSQAAVERIRACDAEILEDNHVNSLARQREIRSCDPDGYVVVVGSGFGNVDRPVR